MCITQKSIRAVSLSIGYRLVQWFSEDIDFKIKSDTSKNRSDYKAFRKTVIELINTQDDFEIDMGSIFSADESKFFSFNISYPHNHELDNSLRNSIKLEMHFQEEALLSENKQIQSFISQFTKSDAETNIACVSPLETAADKFSALLWRINTRDRSHQVGSSKNDPTLVRHLHDLCALEKHVINNKNFIPTIIDAFNADIGRGGLDNTLTLTQVISSTIELLTTEELEYRREYTQFVEAMSYAKDDERIIYDEAIKSFTRIANIVSGGDKS
jgi:predicted nucleotidyltransferase component of viral defense system